MYSVRTTLVLRNISEASQDSNTNSLILNLLEIQNSPGEILCDKVLDISLHPNLKFCIEVTDSTKLLL